MNKVLTTLMFSLFIFSSKHSLASSSLFACNISDIDVSDFSSCNDNGTPFPGDDFFTFDITITFSDAPSSGDLIIKRYFTAGNEIIASAPVSSLSGTSYIFNDVPLSVYIDILNLEAFFSTNPDCSHYEGEIFLPDVLGSCPTTCFIVVNAIATDETCPGFSDGIIQINAEGPGQIFYSINNGSNFNLTGNFNNLTPGTYNILVVSHGDLVCYGYAEVLVNGGLTPEIYYKDFDDDGYSDGLTLEVCIETMAPLGYKCLSCLSSSEIDCDDSNPLINPATVWYQDEDSDGYGNGTTYMGCVPPKGYYLPSQLNGTASDCNDVQYIGDAFNPGKLELCNGLDDNCDGNIDEDLEGAVRNGSVILRTQAEVDNFFSCFSTLTGSLVITGPTINNLTSIQNLSYIGGNLSIVNTDIANLNGLQNINHIGGKLIIVNNSCLNDNPTIALLQAVTTGTRVIFGNGPCTP